MVNHGDRHRAPVLFQNLWIRPCLPLSTSKKLFRAWQFLSVRNDLTNFQDELFVTSHFLVTSWKKVLMSFLCSETRLFIWVLKFIFFRWIFQKIVSKTTTFIYFFPKKINFFLYKRDMVSAKNLIFYWGMLLCDFGKCLGEITIVLPGTVRVNCRVDL